MLLVPAVPPSNYTRQTPVAVHLDLADESLSQYADLYRRASHEWNNSGYLRLIDSFATLRQELENAGSVKENWDSYGAPAPNSDSVHAARQLLATMRNSNLQPTGVRASAEGGIAIYFVRGGRYAHIEALNSGDIAGVMYEKTGDPEAFEVSQTGVTIDNAIQKLREYHAK